MEEVARFGSASLSQVAKLIGQSDDQVLATAEGLVGDGAANRGWLRADAVTALLEGVLSPLPRSDVEPLILKAFRQAQESPKADWTTMAVPVLKNRLLQLSSGEFRESDYGSPNIWHFVTQFPEVLAAEGARPHERVRLIEPEAIEADSRATPAALDPAGLGRIRQDLWRAVFDYSAQETFVWDERKGRARVRTHSDTDSLPVLPTLSAEDMGELRAEFVRLQERVSDYDATRLDEWAARGGPTAALPRLYRGLWNAHLKSHAANALRAFFLAEDLDVPTDLVGGVLTPDVPEREAEQLRRLAHRYIDAMTADELGRLSFEMAVVARVPARGEN
ncbi:hypothetical protein MN032_01505 [Agromyces atrinae]|uniref:hypothetical protein n=1 Tax=Agromyces atrinae TaxID=592376 RepID=UPI001F5885F2|nr:hypothetical protein [Agromyces atrinae]MCI2956353.1 hypothetical protein [Agromyces atrinae]